jgi:hypothetical protein
MVVGPTSPLSHSSVGPSQSSQNQHQVVPIQSNNNAAAAAVVASLTQDNGFFSGSGNFC